MADANVQRDMVKDYRELLNQSVDWVWRSTPQGEFTYLSPSIKTMTGFAPEELLHRPFSSYGPVLFTDKSIKLITQSLKKRSTGEFGNDPIRFDLVYKRKDGSEFVGEMCSSPVLDSHGEIIAIQGTTRDMTAQRLLVKELRGSIELFSIFFHSNDNPCCMTDPLTGLIIYANDAWLSRFDCSLDELTDNTLSTLGVFDETTSTTLVDIIGKVKANDNSIQGNIFLTTKTGEVEVCNVTSFCVDIAGVERIFTSIIDKTDNERIESELLKVAGLESVNTLADGVAHELKNLVAGVLGNLKLAEKADSIELKDEYVDKTSVAAASLSDLTDRIIELCEAKDSSLQLTDVGKLLGKCVPLPLHGTRVTHKIEIDDNLWQVNTNPGQIKQLVNNLVINAQQAMPDGGEITASAKNFHCAADNPLGLRPGRYIKVSIADQGIGFSEEVEHKLFDAFFTTKNKARGLGLTSSKSIIEKCQGCIETSSTPGVGTTMSFYLPTDSDGVSLEIV